MSKTIEAIGAIGAVALALAAAACSDGSVARESVTPGVVAPPPPPSRALVLAGESGRRAVALAVGDGRLTATVLAPTGEPVSGLSVSFAAGSRTIPARACGAGCYSARAPRPEEVEVQPEGSRPLSFRVPARTPSAAAIVARATRATRALRSLVYIEDLRSGPTGGLHTTWKLVAPDRVEYDISGGSSAVVIGQRRWDRDRAGAPWRRSQQLPPLRVPQPAWGARATNAHVIGTSRVAGRPVWIVTFANPTTPAWFTAWVDRTTYRPLRLRMTAAAHFMLHRYLAFDEAVKIRPPR